MIHAVRPNFILVTTNKSSSTASGRTSTKLHRVPIRLWFTVPLIVSADLPRDASSRGSKAVKHSSYQAFDTLLQHYSVLLNTLVRFYR